MGKNDPKVVAGIVAGVAEGCRQAGCALVGGETAEMPGMYPDGEYDIAGFSVGAVEKDDLIDSSEVSEGDILLALPSSGVHSNGFSLVRKIISDNNLDINKVYPELDPEKTLGEVLLTPTKIYVRPVLSLLKDVRVKGIAHITGGGFFENIPRILPDGLAAEINLSSWTIPAVFNFLEKYGKVPHLEMFNIFNMGVGMVLAVNASDAERAVARLAEEGQEAWVVGKVEKLNADRVVLK